MAHNISLTVATLMFLATFSSSANAQSFDGSPANTPPSDVSLEAASKLSEFSSFLKLPPVNPNLFPGEGLFIPPTPPTPKGLEGAKKIAKDKYEIRVRMVPGTLGASYANQKGLLGTAYHLRFSKTEGKRENKIRTSFNSYGATWIDYSTVSHGRGRISQVTPPGGLKSWASYEIQVNPVSDDIAEEMDEDVVEIPTVQMSATCQPEYILAVIPNSKAVYSFDYDFFMGTEKSSQLLPNLQFNNKENFNSIKNTAGRKNLPTNLRRRAKAPTTSIVKRTKALIKLHSNLKAIDYTLDNYHNKSTTKLGSMSWNLRVDVYLSTSNGLVKEKIEKVLVIGKTGEVTSSVMKSVKLRYEVKARTR